MKMEGETESKPERRKHRKRCKNCNTRIIEYPIYKGQEQDIPLLKGDSVGEKIRSLFSKETKQRINWYNLIIGDWTKLLILVALIFVAWAYTHDIRECRELLEDPCGFIDTNKAACEVRKNIEKNPFMIPEEYIDFGLNENVRQNSP